MRRMWFMALAALAVVVLWTALQVPSREPTYGGRPLSAWLDAGTEPAAMAVHELGPPAIPWILRKLRWEHPRWGRWESYQHFWRRVPRFARRILPKPRIAAFDDTRAAMLLLEIGPMARPQLIAALKDSNPAVRLACAKTLGTLREQGFKDQRTLDALRAASRDQEAAVRKETASIIARVESPPPP